MAYSTPEEIVRCLLWDFYGSFDRSIQYAEMVASGAGGELSTIYARAAEILKDRRVIASSQSISL